MNTSQFITPQFLILDPRNTWGRPCPGRRGQREKCISGKYLYFDFHSNIDIDTEIQIPALYRSALPKTRPSTTIQAPGTFRPLASKFKSSDTRTDIGSCVSVKERWWTNLCVDWGGCFRAGCLWQLRAEGGCSWCCWGRPGPPSRSLGRSHSQEKWLPRPRPAACSGEVGTCVTAILRSLHCWRTRNLPERHRPTSHSTQRRGEGPLLTVSNPSLKKLRRLLRHETK